MGRRHFDPEPTCSSGKRAWRNYPRAAVNGIPEVVGAYRCPVCGFWHITGHQRSEADSLWADRLARNAGAPERDLDGFDMNAAADDLMRRFGPPKDQPPPPRTSYTPWPRGDTR